MTTIYYLTTSNTCLSACPAGQFINEAIPNTCSACSAECVTCLGNASFCTGSICQTGFNYYNNLCLTTCPNNTYTFNGQCLL